eukprot:TRINITY_DN16776_c0_g1_i1.p1 TRINITY_DN16776_c0_g1~~TRINITY_DN16776_c0_g1_i1.p1  ORF type:complete len:147 (+),score=29.43 TRINITY_DN16776_c0_g1_i1:61-441(+)
MDIDPVHVLVAVAVILMMMMFMKGQGPSINASHILVKEENVAADLYQTLTTEDKENVETKFKQLATAHSVCPSGKQSGGSLGSFGLNMMDPIFETACINADIGVPTKPVYTQFGYHIILVHSRTGF